MTRKQRYILLVVILLVLFVLSSCSMLKKPCPRADDLIAKAAILCPGKLEQQQTTAAVSGDTVTLPAPSYSQVEVDSLLEACEEFQRAYAQEADMLREATTGTPLVKVVERIRKEACRYNEFNFDHPLFSLHIPAGEHPVATVTVKDREVVVECPPQITQVINQGVAEWWRTYALTLTVGPLLGLVVVVMLIKFSSALKST